MPERCPRPGEEVDLSGVVRTGSGLARFTHLNIRGTDGGTIFSGGPLRVEVRIHAKEPMTAHSIAVTLYDLSGFKLVNADTLSLGAKIELAEGENTLRFDIRQLYFEPRPLPVGVVAWRDTHKAFSTESKPRRKWKSSRTKAGLLAHARARTESCAAISMCLDSSRHTPCAVS